MRFAAATLCHEMGTPKADSATLCRTTLTTDIASRQPTLSTRSARCRAKAVQMRSASTKPTRNSPHRTAPATVVRAAAAQTGPSFIALVPAGKQERARYDCIDRARADLPGGQRILGTRPKGALRIDELVDPALV